MSLISKLLGKSEDPLDRQAGSLVSAAQVHATASYIPTLQRFPIVGTVPAEQWDFFVTVAGVFVAATRLNSLRLPEAREHRLMDRVGTDLNEWSSDGIRAFEDCKALFEQEFDRLTGLRHDPQFTTADALGLWIVWNLLRRRPTTDENIGLVRGIGALTTHAFFAWWDV
jgi:hypothetical protein